VCHGSKPKVNLAILIMNMDECVDENSVQVELVLEPDHAIAIVRCAWSDSSEMTRVNARVESCSVIYSVDIILAVGLRFHGFRIYGYRVNGFCRFCMRIR
jgi:hypothetical protein